MTKPINIPFPTEPIVIRESRLVNLPPAIKDWTEEDRLNDTVRTNRYGGDPIAIKEVVVDDGRDAFHKELRDAYCEMKVAEYNGKKVIKSVKLTRLYNKRITKSEKEIDTRVISGRIRQIEAEIELDAKARDLQNLAKAIREGKILTDEDADFLDNFVNVCYACL